MVARSAGSRLGRDDWLCLELEVVCEARRTDKEAQRASTCRRLGANKGPKETTTITPTNMKR